MSAATIPVPAAAARSSRNAVCSDRCWSRSCLHRHGLVLARRILQPAPEVVGERAPDVEVEGRPLAVIVAHLVQRDGGVGEVALRAVALAVVGATAEGAGVQVERAALGDRKSTRLNSSN